MDYNLLSNIEISSSTFQKASTSIYYAHVPIIILTLLFGLFVYYKNKKLLISKILLALSLTFSLWTFFDFVTWYSYVNYRNIVFVWPLLEVLAILFFSLSLYFTYVFIEKKDIPFLIKVILGVLVLPSILLAPTRFSVSYFDLQSCEAVENSFFQNYTFAVQIIIALGTIAYIIYQYIKRRDKDQRNQIMILGVGIIIFLLSFFFTGYISELLNTYGEELAYVVLNYGLFGMPILLGFLSYLILKHQAFDIKVIAAQFLVVTVWIGVFSQLFIVQERSNQILTAITLALVTYFGWMLFKSVKEEVKTGEQLALAGRKLAGLNIKLEELDRAKSEFISIASHQLRTPLTSVKGFTSLILDNTFGKVPLPQKKAVEKVFVNNEKLCLLVEDMLNASRLEAGRLEYELEEADLVSVVKSTVSVISLYAKSKKIKLTVQYPKEKVLRAIIDQRKVSEILSNLIDNAIKYTPKGSVTVTLEKFKKAMKVGKMENTGTVNGNWTRLSVTDTGIGMSEKQAEEIFEKFKEGAGDTTNQPTDPSTAAATASAQDDNKANNGNGNNMTSGTGLGVYISRQMAQAMGGKLFAESPGKGKGSTFILELPLVKK
jgi:signal transduction histidine kinase